MPSPAPWRFHESCYGVKNAIVDADKRILASRVPVGDSPLMAAAPTMLAILRRVAATLPKGDELGELARRAIALVESVDGRPKV